MKKIFSIISILLIFILTGCTNITTTVNRLTTSHKDTVNYVELPDLTGMNRDEIKNTLDNLGISFIFGFDTSKYYGPDGYNKFVKYQNKTIGELVDPTKTIRVYTSQLELPEFNYQELLPWTKDLEGKSFINDSYGYVTWRDGTYADGDTTTFYDPIAGQSFKVRFLCLDTNEVSHGPGELSDPWGDAAGDFIKSMLRNANKIWVESESDTSTGQDIYGRYLGYVWVDGICLNLAMVGEAYSNNKSNSNSSKYFKVFDSVETAVMGTGRRFYGEYDPNALTN